MRTTIKTIAILTGLVGLVIGNSVLAQNLLLNPGFETGNTTDWSMFGQGTYASVAVLSGINGPSALGTYSAFMDNNIQANNLALQQSTAAGDAVPGLVNYSFDAEGNTSFNGGVFFVHIWDINSTGGVIDQGPGLLQPSLTTGSWTTFTGSWTAPASVDHFEIELDCTTGAEPNSTEHVYVDNVSITQVPEPASLSLAAIGLAGLGILHRSRKA